MKSLSKRLNAVSGAFESCNLSHYTNPGGKYNALTKTAYQQ